MTRILSGFAVVFLVLVAIGCTTAPVLNVEGAAVVASKPVSADDVQKAIIRAARRLGWTANATGPGKIEGILVLRTHRAVVDIAYDAKTYSIRYKDSTNLDYTGGSIHRNYNGWIQNLDKGIQTELQTL